MRVLTWVGNGLTLLGGAAAIASPMLKDEKSTAVAIGGGVVALVGAVISMYMGHTQGKELDAVRELGRYRELDKSSSIRLATEMRRFAGQKFELYVHDHNESRRFAEELGQCLLDAGWEQVVPRGNVLTGDGKTNLVDMQSTGVIIGGPWQQPEDQENPDRTLVAHIKKLGFEAKSERHVEFDRFPDRVHVYVGMKMRGLPE